MAYQKNTWVIFEEGIPAHEQPDAFITKDKLENIETGIRSAVTDFVLGTVSKGTDVQCEIISDENDPSVKRINLVIPKEVSWLFSEVELTDQSVAPTGATVIDMVLDSKGNIFTITENSNGILILNKKLNINGKPGIDGSEGPPGEPGDDGKDGNKWVYINTKLFEGDSIADGNIGDFVLDNNCNVYQIIENHILHKVFNIKGDEYYLEIGSVAVGDEASAEVVDHKLNLVLPIGPRGIQGIQGIQGPEGPIGPEGPPGESPYDIWKGLGNTGDAFEFIQALKGEPGPAPVKGVDYFTKEDTLSTLDEVLVNEKEGMFIDALVVKEMYLKIQEQIASSKN